MRELDELVVSFERGVPEEEARTLVEKKGGTVRRRMRNDRPDEVILLVQIEEKEFDRVHREIEGSTSVMRTEINRRAFKAL